MDSAILQKDLFIGKSELQTTFDGLSDYSKKFLKSIVKTYGLMNNPNDINFTNFKVITGSSNNSITLKAGIAFDTNLNLIKSDSNLIDAISIPIGTTYYVILQNSVTSQELGTCSIDSAGVVTGTNTEFLRFRNGDFAQRIKFLNTTLNATLNADGFEINTITSNTQLQLSGSSFTAESGLTYKILGNFTFGTIISDKSAFTYNRPSITLATSDISNGLTSFCLASVYNSGIALTITDLRTQLLDIVGSYSDLKTQILINKLIIGATTTSIIIDLGVLKIDKINSYFEITGDSSSITDIVYNDNSTVTTGKVIFLKIASTGFTFLTNGFSGSNISFPSDSIHNSLKITNDFIILIKTSTKWVFHGGISSLFDSTIWTQIITFYLATEASGVTYRKISYKLFSGNKIFINGSFILPIGTYNTGDLVLGIPIYPLSKQDFLSSIYVDYLSGSICSFSLNPDGAIKINHTFTVSFAPLEVFINVIIPLD